MKLRRWSVWLRTGEPTADVEWRHRFFFKRSAIRIARMCNTPAVGEASIVSLLNPALEKDGRAPWRYVVEKVRE